MDTENNFKNLVNMKKKSCEAQQNPIRKGVLQSEHVCSGIRQHIFIYMSNYITCLNLLNYSVIV